MASWRSYGPLIKSLRRLPRWNEHLEGEETVWHLLEKLRTTDALASPRSLPRWNEHLEGEETVWYPGEATGEITQEVAALE